MPKVDRARARQIGCHHRADEPGRQHAVGNTLAKTAFTRLHRVHMGGVKISRDTRNEFSSGEGALAWLDRHPGELDVLFLDIEMPGLDGMETARRVRMADANLLLVFATGFADYVFDGYAVNALDYLLKPVSPQKLAAVIKRILGVVELRAPDTYSFKNTLGMFRIPKADILYLQSEGRQVHLVTAQRRYTFYDKLNTVHQELGASFIRIHQRYLVRCAAVDSFLGDSVTVNSCSLPVSRSMRAQVMAEISEHLLRKDVADV